MMFKKGSFEIGGTIYPVAIKVNKRLLFSRTGQSDPAKLDPKNSSSKSTNIFLLSFLYDCLSFFCHISLVSYLLNYMIIQYDPLFSNAFWNSSQYSMVHYLLDIMSSWALVCDIWYLPPVTRREVETAIEFANRVKADIARQGGLVDLIWYVKVQSLLTLV